MNIWKLHNIYIQHIFAYTEQHRCSNVLAYLGSFLHTGPIVTYSNLKCLSLFGAAWKCHSNVTQCRVLWQHSGELLCA